MGSGKLFFALMYRDKSIIDKIISLLTNDFGGIISKRLEYDFNFTDYYQEEFGNDLKKILVVFDRIIDKKDLIEIKIITSQIENEFCNDDKRTANIDPGYFNEKEVVLASFKGKDFKENLGDGVFAHKVLEFNNGIIKDFPHTFLDFRQEKLQKFLLNLRL